VLAEALHDEIGALRFIARGQLSGPQRASGARRGWRV
jgi:hypothetical protein